jgi:glycosyltransferase involved in cell wall biosynthesis
LSTVPYAPKKPVAAVIPVFNERNTIADVVRRTIPFVDRVIVVDDGSTDDSGRALDGLDVEFIRQPVNRGKGAALMRGIEAAKAAGAGFAVTIDADNQHPPECIPDLLRQADDAHIVIGSRASDASRIPTARLRANRTANFFISWACGHWIEDTQCGFRVYPTGLFDRIRVRRHRRSGFVFESEVLIAACRQGYRVAPVPIPALYSEVLQRPSHFRPVFDVSAIVIMVTGKLVVRAFYPTGLIRSQRERRAQAQHPSCNRPDDGPL